MFWQNHLDTAKCQKYILHLRKVLPKIVEENGGPNWLLGLQSGGSAGVESFREMYA